MSIRDRVTLGINFLSIFKATKKLVENSEFEANQLPEMAKKILDEIVGNKNLEGIDIDALLNFIIEVLPIVMQLLILFA